MHLNKIDISFWKIISVEIERRFVINHISHKKSIYLWKNLNRPYLDKYAFKWEKGADLWSLIVHAKSRHSYENT